MLCLFYFIFCEVDLKFIYLKISSNSSKEWGVIISRIIMIKKKGSFLQILFFIKEFQHSKSRNSMKCRGIICNTNGTVYLYLSSLFFILVVKKAMKNYDFLYIAPLLLWIRHKHIFFRTVLSKKYKIFYKNNATQCSYCYYYYLLRFYLRKIGVFRKVIQTFKTFTDSLWNE